MQDAAAKLKEEMGEVLRAEDIADAIVHALAAPPHVSINEVLVRPTLAAHLDGSSGARPPARRVVPESEDSTRPKLGN